MMGRGTQKTNFKKEHYYCVHKLLSAMVVCTRPAEDQTDQSHDTGRSGDLQAPPLTEEFLAGDSCWGESIIPFGYAATRRFPMLQWVTHTHTHLSSIN